MAACALSAAQTQNRGIFSMTQAIWEQGYTQNRELSWLQFNARVLAEAEDDSVPLLERCKFLSIFTSNLCKFNDLIDNRCRIELFLVENNTDMLRKSCQHFSWMARNNRC